MRTALSLVLPLLAMMPFASAQEEPPDEPEPGPAPARPVDPELRLLADKAGRGVKWRRQDDLDGAVAEAAESGKLIFLYAYDRSRSSMFGNAFKDQFMMAGPFSDTELVEFINRKFVPVRVKLTAIVAADLGTRLNDVVIPAMLFVDAERKIVHQYDRVTSASTELLFLTCRQVLQKRPEADKPGPLLERREKEAVENPKDARARYLLGLELLWEGRWERSLEVFTAVLKDFPDSREAVEAAYRSAWIHRLARRPADAEAALDAAAKANAAAGVKIEGNLLVERGLLKLRQGKRADARGLFEQAAEKHAKDSRAAEARYYLGALLWAEDQEEDAKKAWRELAKSEPRGPWHRKAAAEALEEGPLTNGWESYEWLDAAALAGDPRGTERPRKPEEYPDVVRQALEYLAREQRLDGSWRNPRGNGQFNFKECVSVIGVMALRTWEETHPGIVKESLERGRKYVDAWSDRKTAARGMTEWDHCFAIFHYARTAASLKEGDERKAAVKRCRRAIKALAAVQRPKGTWSYIDEGPSSFLTGGILVALWEAKQAGIEFDPQMVEHGLEGLLKLKSTDDREEYKDTYFYTDQGSDDFDDAHIKGSVGRMAICYLAEFLWGKCDAAKLSWAIGRFVEFRIHLMRVKKSTDWHAGKYANASYFFFYDYWFASMAALKLPDPLKTKACDAIRADLLQTCEIDGSWVDTHLFGKPYGTAMALMILKNTGGNNAK